MNKFIIIALAVALLIGGGIGYKAVGPKGNQAVVTGKVVRAKIIAIKDQWRFEPEDLEVTRGDRVIMEVVNEDSYDHGIAIDAFGVSQRMPANSTITAEFIVTKDGEFPVYCSVPCGEGMVDGKKRTHFDMIGKLKVKPVQ
jgi:cytochrome c oxidase subunit II